MKEKTISIYVITFTGASLSWIFLFGILWATLQECRDNISILHSFGLRLIHQLPCGRCSSEGTKQFTSLTFIMLEQLVSISICTYQFWMLFGIALVTLDEQWDVDLFFYGTSSFKMLAEMYYYGKSMSSQNWTRRKVSPSTKIIKK